jgi:hypothetical protein
LTTTPKNNSEVCFAIAHVAPYRGTNWRIITTLRGVRSQIVDIMTLIGEHFNEVLFQGVPSVIGANCNA